MERDDPPPNTTHSVQAEVAVAQAAASAERTPKNAAAKLHTRRPITEEFFTQILPGTRMPDYKACKDRRLAESTHRIVPAVTIETRIQVCAKFLVPMSQMLNKMPATATNLPQGTRNPADSRCLERNTMRAAHVNTKITSRAIAASVAACAKLLYRLIVRTATELKMIAACGVRNRGWTDTITSGNSPL